MEKIPPESNIYRAIKSKRWKEQKHLAFLLRRVMSDGTPEKELSVITTAKCTKEICFAGQNTCFGELLIIAEQIRELGFDVVPRPLENNSYHATIINLPLYTEETIESAERTARILARHIVAVQERPK